MATCYLRSKALMKLMLAASRKMGLLKWQSWHHKEVRTMARGLGRRRCNFFKLGSSSRKSSNASAMLVVRKPRT